MQRLTGMCSCFLIIIANFVSVAVASGGGKVPIYPKICVPAPPGVTPNQCCKQSNINFDRICSAQLEIFRGGDTIEAATIMSSLASAMDHAAAVPGATPAKQAEAQCLLRNYWASIGADFTSVRFFFKTVTITGVPQGTITLTGGAAVFTAGTNVYLIFGGAKSGAGDTSGFATVETNFVANGKDTITNKVFLDYYNAFREPGADVIAETLEQLHLPPASTKTERGSAWPRDLFIAGYSAGAISSVYATFDLMTDGQQTATGVYLFGIPKVGNQALVDAYRETPNYSVTSAWYNKLDITLQLPPATKRDQQQMAQYGNFSSNDIKLLDSWGVYPNFALLPSDLYWRIAPANTGIAGVTEGMCIKVTSSPNFRRLYFACPGNPRNFKCGLNFNDRFSTEYQTNIKACALENFDKYAPRRRYAFNPTCINDFVLPDGFSP